MEVKMLETAKSLEKGKYKKRSIIYYEYDSPVRVVRPWNWYLTENQYGFSSTWFLPMELLVSYDETFGF